MSSHNSDDSMSTGKHRIVAEESRRLLASAGGPLREPQRTWLNRTQPPNSRHAAITRSLYSWSNYKNWTDKINKSWAKDRSEK